MEIETFEDALAFYRFARMMREDLPDGQYEQIREIVQDYVQSYGKKSSLWPEDAKEGFTQEMRDNMFYWL